MTDGTAGIVGDIRRAIALLAELDDRAATRVAEALSRWLDGEDFDSAADLAPGWRRALQQAAREAGLAALVPLHPELDDSALAAWIAAGVARAARTRGLRPDGEAGHFHDLARADVGLTLRTWRWLIARARGKASGAIATTPCHRPRNRRS